MSPNDFLALLRIEAERINQIAPHSVWYLFGSAARGYAEHVDIDVLVLCQDSEHVRSVRSELKGLYIRLPLHLFLLTRTEEAELGFVASQGCIQIYPASS